MEISPIEEIKSKLDIVEVISSYINLKRCGRNFRALCPFHSEKNPSFFVSPERQIWHCFGCSRGGDVFKFVMLIEGIEFGEALKILAQKAGVELKPIKPELKTERMRLFEICELATKFFQKQLESKTGKEVLDYLKGRGINDESIQKWRIGWAPKTFDSLIKFLVSKGYKKEEIEKAGLAIKTESGKYYDRFRGRIIFPIFDLNSQVIGFGGRIFKEEEGAKYINTPNTLLYDKSKVLYGLNEAKVEIRKRDFCILVEGYTDVILAHQVGFENTVSSCGTSLSPFQLRVLKRYSDNLYLAFDMDIAGDFATKRGIDLAQLSGFNIKVVSLPQNKDPADVISENPTSFQEAILNSLSILEFYFQSAFSKYDKKTLEGKKEIAKMLLPVIKRIPNQIEKAHWISKLARELEVREENIERELEKIKIEEETLGIEAEESLTMSQKSRTEILQERILVLLLKSPENIKIINEETISLFDSKASEILQKIKANQKLTPEEFSPETKEYFNILSLRAELEEIDQENILTDLKFCLKELQSIKIKEKIKEISEKLRMAEVEKNFEKVQQLTEQLRHLTEKLAKL